MAEKVRRCVFVRPDVSEIALRVMRQQNHRGDLTPAPTIRLAPALDYLLRRRLDMLQPCQQLTFEAAQLTYREIDFRRDAAKDSRHRQVQWLSRLVLGQDVGNE